MNGTMTWATCAMRRTPPKITIATTVPMPAAVTQPGAPHASSSALTIALDCVPGSSSPQPITVLSANSTAYQRLPRPFSM